MAWGKPLSLEQLSSILDNAPVAVYVSAMDNHELLYANCKAKQLFLKQPESQGLRCYTAAGFDEPCFFCQEAKLNDTELLVREFHHPENNKIYELSGKIIDWNGRKAHIEYIVDVTDKKQKETRNNLLIEEIKATFCNIPTGLCIYRIENDQIIPLFHNPAFFNIMGFNDEHIEQIKKAMRFLGVHPEDLSALKDKLEKLVHSGEILQHTFRVYNDKLKEYRWIRLEGSMKQQNGTTWLYGVYSDVNEQQRLEKELAGANKRMENIINSIPGGVAIYKVGERLETIYYSDGVPGLNGYTSEEFHELVKHRSTATMVYHEDYDSVKEKVYEVIRTHVPMQFEFRMQHRKGYIVWVRAQISWMGENENSPLIHCVFHNISDLKETQLEMDQLINSIPGGIISFRLIDNKIIPTYFSDGLPELLGYTREEYSEIIRTDGMDVVYVNDRKRVLKAVKDALTKEMQMDVSCRMHNRQGQLTWIHINARRISSLTEDGKLYAVLTGMSPETRLFQSIANETADGIYVIDKDNLDILYANESKELISDSNLIGKKCYQALYNQKQPCAFCTLDKHKANGVEHQMIIDGSDHYFNTRFIETDWNGIPAYVKYVRDITKEVEARKEKERLEQYFQTVVKNLPGGVAVVNYKKDGSLVPEYLSDGFAEMTDMSLDEAWRLYKQDAMTGVHPDDVEAVNQKMMEFIKNDENHCEITYRLKKGKDKYIWVKNTLSLIQNEDGEHRVYAVYHDITAEREEQELIRQQYKDLIVQHYTVPDPDVLVMGHCNITQNRIIEIKDQTNSGLLEHFGYVREEFFLGIASLVVDDEEREKFKSLYLNEPALAAFKRNDTEQILRCFIKLPQEPKGRYVQFKVNLVETPDTGDITGILTVTDITDQTIVDRILHQLSVISYDFVIDLNLDKDTFSVLTSNGNNLMPETGCHSAWTASMENNAVVPKDKKTYANAMNKEEMLKRLKTEGRYTFAYSLTDENGDIRTKNMTVSAIDLRIGRVCLVRADITDSVREQQGLLNMMAYTFELMALINIQTSSMTMYTRETVLDNLTPYYLENYEASAEKFSISYEAGEDNEEIRELFRLDTLLKGLEEKPVGYDFVYPYQSVETGQRYKQINVLWGDANHQTICLVRADVTDMLTSERKAKKTLEEALLLAEEANQAKSDFLTSMSHDIRTPMNAIIGMTALAVAHLDNTDKVSDCLQKISVSSKHLLSLINDILDMSKIEQAKISLNRMKISYKELMNQFIDIMMPQAKASGIQFKIEDGDIKHTAFWGDTLRISQIMINILSNAIKYTPAGGEVLFKTEEITPLDDSANVRYRFTVRDNGIGMPEDFLKHVFEPFTRSSVSARIEGTGLGLSITKGLVDLMNGSIAVTSEVNKGSEFVVELEFEIADEDNDSKQVSVKSDMDEKREIFKDKRFLIAEDNAINAEILSELLQMFGAESKVVGDGIKAVEAFNECQPDTYDAILMDIQMPDMNGYEATRKIRGLKREDAKTIPIIAMTANAFAEDIQSALDSGMNAHISKPIDLALLKNTLKKFLK